MNIHGQAALVTGGASGIGLATVEMFARSGATVALNHLPDDRRGAEQVERLKADGRRVIAAPGNVARPGEAEDMVAEAEAVIAEADAVANAEEAEAVAAEAEATGVEALIMEEDTSSSPSSSSSSTSTYRRLGAVSLVSCQILKSKAVSIFHLVAKSRVPLIPRPFPIFLRDQPNLLAYPVTRSQGPMDSTTVRFPQ